MLWCCIDRRLAEFTVNSSRSDPLYDPTASVSSGSLGRARFRVLSPCSERLFVALSCLDTLWQEVSSKAIYVSDAVGLEGVMNSSRNGLGIRETEIARETSRP